LEQYIKIGYAKIFDLRATKKTSYPIAQRLFAMRRYGGGMLYAALPLHMQRDCFRIRTHDQQVTKAQLYRCTRARPQNFVPHCPEALRYANKEKGNILTSSKNRPSAKWAAVITYTYFLSALWSLNKHFWDGFFQFILKHLTP